MLNINASWSKPIELLDGSNDNAIYRVADLARVPEAPGAYAFARRHGKNVVPLYIGETTNLRKRLEQHLNDVWVMKSIENAPSGKRLYMYCQVRTKQGQKLERVLDSVVTRFEI
ncbi:MAG: GIY-YIG nuclease family protein [Nitrospira sp.]|nr:GIY-YIG nuclease family protein [Nitrospira sp.]